MGQPIHAEQQKQQLLLAWLAVEPGLQNLDTLPPQVLDLEECFHTVPQSIAHLVRPGGSATYRELIQRLKRMRRLATWIEDEDGLDTLPGMPEGVQLLSDCGHAVPESVSAKVGFNGPTGYGAVVERLGHMGALLRFLDGHPDGLRPGDEIPADVLKLKDCSVPIPSASESTASAAVGLSGRVSYGLIVGRLLELKAAPATDQPAAE